MKALYLSLTFLSFVGLYAQGLRGEHTFNDNYNHAIHGVVCSGDETFVFNSNWTFSTPFIAQGVRLCKMDANGNKAWEMPSTPPLGETPEFLAAVEDDNAVTYLCGSREACDYSTSYRYCFRKVTSSGVVLWENVWIDSGESFYASFMSNVSGLTRDNTGKYLFNYSLNEDFIDSSSVSILNSDGTLFQLLEIDQYALSEIRLGNQHYILGSSGNKLFGFDNNGHTQNAIELSENILNFSQFNDKIYILTASKVYVFNEDFSPVENADFSSFGTCRTLKIVDGELQLLMFQNDQYLILVLDENLAVINTKNIIAQLPANAKVDFNNSHFAVGNAHALYYSASSRFRDFSLSNPFNIQTNWTDIGITDVEVVNIILQPTPNSTPGVQNATISVKAKLTNFGDEILNSCRINYHQGMHYICGQLGFSQEYFDLNLAPGESTWIELGVVHNETNYFNSSTGVIERNICLYTSYPKQQTDLIVNNDHFCKSVVLGYVGLDEHGIPTQEKTLVKIIDLLGREVPYQTNQVMIYLYSDGSSEKVFVVE